MHRMNLSCFDIRHSEICCSSFPHIAGFPDTVLQRSRKRKADLIEGSLSKRPKDLLPGTFIPKHPEVTLRKSYRGVFESEWWDKWPRRELPAGPTTPINVNKMVSRAEQAGIKDMHSVNLVANNLRFGAPLGAKNAGRLPYEGPNNNSCYSNGHLWCDAMAGYIKKNFVCGPFKR